MGRTRQQQKNAETRNAILETAMAVGLEEGFDAISIRKITDRLDYSAAIVYHYFSDKQEILDTIHEMKSKELMDKVSSYIYPDKSFADNCRTVFKVLCEISRYDEDMIRTLLFGGSSRMDHSVGPWLDMIQKCIQFGRDSGELRPVDVDVLSYLLLNTFTVTQKILYAEGQESTEVHNQKLEEKLMSELDIILNGVIVRKENK